MCCLISVGERRSHKMRCQKGGPHFVLFLRCVLQKNNARQRQSKKHPLRLLINLFLAVLGHSSERFMLFIHLHWTFLHKHSMRSDISCRWPLLCITPALLHHYFEKAVVEVAWVLKGDLMGKKKEEKKERIE